MNDVALATTEPVDAMLATALRLGEAFAKSGMFGCDKVEQGTVLAMHCLMEKKSPLALMSEYNIIQGRMSIRADAMLAKLSQAGGQFQWKADGSDGKTATMAIEFKGREGTVTYTMQDALRAGIVLPSPCRGCPSRIAFRSLQRGSPCSTASRNSCMSPLLPHPDGSCISLNFPFVVSLPG